MGPNALSTFRASPDGGRARSGWPAVGPPPSYAREMVARVLALLAAVAMVAGALVVRSRIDETEERTSAPLRLVCATELEAACTALDKQKGSTVQTTVEPAATTADTLTKLAPGEAPPLDGWLVTAPWPAIVEGARTRNASTRLLRPGSVLARSPVVLAVREGRHATLVSRCNGPPGWRCLGEVAGMRWSELPGGQAGWGVVKPGYPSASSAAGLTVMGGALAAYFAPRADLSRADLDDGQFQSWLDRLEGAVPERPPSPLEILLQRPTAFDAVGSLEAGAGPQVLRAREPKPVLLYPSPVVTADVVLATIDGPVSELLSEVVSSAASRGALASAGWRVNGEKLVPGIPPMDLPPTSNLPDPGVLDALRARLRG